MLMMGRRKGNRTGRMTEDRLVKIAKHKSPNVGHLEKDRMMVSIRNEVTLFDEGRIWKKMY